MRRLPPVLALVGMTFVFVTLAAPAQAQATRTWVSGVGDDANPCSRTAPCKTFAGAISKTASGGEIDCLDPAGFGALTITKAITIECNGTLGSVLAVGTNGIVVAAPNAAVVILRGLAINGAGLGINGIRFLSGAQLSIEGCFIFGFTNNGIDVSVSTIADLYVTNSYITSANKGIVVATTASQLVAAINNTSMLNMGTNGFEATGGAIVATLTNTVITSTGSGVVVSGAGPQVNVETSTVANNGTAFSANAAGATIRVSNNGIYNNGMNFNIAVGGTINSAGNNRVTAGGGAPSGGITLQ